MNGLLLPRHTGYIENRHEGKVITLQSDVRWCSDGFEFRCWHGDKVYVIFSLDCCDREVIAFEAAVECPSGEMVRNVMRASVEARFGEAAITVPHRIEWLSDNGPQFATDETKRFGKSLGLTVCNTPAYSPASNGMAEALVKTFKRDYVYVNELNSAETVLSMLPGWFDDYNSVHPHKGLKMMSPRQFRQTRASPETKGTQHQVEAESVAHRPNAAVYFETNAVVFTKAFNPSVRFDRGNYT